MNHALFESKIKKNYPKERNFFCFSIFFSRFTFTLGNKKFNKEERVLKVTVGLQAKEAKGS